MRAHEAGALHADIGHRAPPWLRAPRDPNDLVPSLWSMSAKKTAEGSLVVGGVDVRDLVAEHGSPAFVLDEDDFRARARAFKTAFKDFDVYYAGKAFLCTTIVRWVMEEGLNLDICSGGELAVALRAGADPKRLGFHGNNKSESELARALDAGVGRIIVDSQYEISRLIELEGSATSSRR